MKTCVSSNLRPARKSGKTNNCCIGCPSFNFSASDKNYVQKISRLDKRRLGRVY